MKSKVKQMLSVILTVCMLATVVPLNAYAADVDFDDSETTDLTVDLDEAADVDISEEEPTEEPDISVEEDSQDEDEADEESQDEEDTFSAGNDVDAFSDDSVDTQSFNYVSSDHSISLPDEYIKIFHLDAGRKYFSVDQIKAIIDTLSSNGYNYMELAVGNDALRFILDDMSVKVGDITYSSDQVKAGIQSGNKTYYDAGSTNELSQSEMDTIISYAKDKGISIIPLLNSPGHMDAIIDCMESLGMSDVAYNGSARTINVANEAAVNFTTTLIQKYADYFGNSGCKVFNMGADEYANDLEYGGGFSSLIRGGNYGYFVKYVNSIAAVIKNAGMAPMAFNDGIYYNGNEKYGAFDKDIAISYWTSGWSGYTPASASFLAGKGHKIINTNDAWYYVLGRGAGNSSGYTISTATNGVTNTKYNDVPGNNDPTPAGSMICVWCDTPSATYNGTEQKNINNLITTFANNNQEIFAIATPTPTKPAEVIPTPPVNDVIDTERTIELVVGETDTDTIKGINYTGKKFTTDDSAITTVKVTNGADAKEESTEYVEVNSVQYDTLINSDNSSWKECKNCYYKANDGSYYPLYAKRGSTWSLKKWSYIYTYTWGYSITGTGNDVIQIGAQESTTDTSGAPQINVYTQSITEATEAFTDLTFTGVSAGTTSAQIGDVHYTLNVVDKAPSNAMTAKNIKIEYWITNFEVYDASSSSTGNQSKTVSSTEANSDEGIAIADIAPNPAYSFFDGTKEVYYWQAMRLDANHEQTDKSGVDQTASGTTLTHVRYHGGAWQYKSLDDVWHYFNEDDQLVAYYLQKTEVTKEVDTYSKDWGYGTNSTTPDTSSKKGQVALTVAVVYPNGVVSPTEGEMYAKSTTVFNYWDGRDIGIVAPQNNSDYNISKITVTDGKRTSNSSANVWYTSDTITWDKTTNDYGTEWYDETEVWNKTSGTTPMVNGKTNNITWSAKNTAKLVLIYLEPVEKETNLNVKYVDDSDNAAVIAQYQISMAYNQGDPEPTFLDKTLVQKSEVKTGEFTLDDDAYVINSKNEKDTFNKDLAILAKSQPIADVKYLSGSYKYAKAEITKDGKTLILHYNIDNSKVKIGYVVDFGEKIDIPLNDLVADTKIVTKIEARSTNISVDGTSITYIPEKVLTGIDIAEVKLIFSSGSSEIKQIAFVPATTVYYEETFVDNGSGAKTLEGKQAAEKPGSAVNNYGYDASYTSGNETKVDLKNNPQSFTFKGTGVDIYADTEDSTGTMMIMVKEGNSYKKIVAVDTKMAVGTSTTTEKQAVSGTNIPVATLDLKTNATYKVSLSCVKSGSEGVKPVYFDGFRVYNTLKDDGGVYANDNEANPSYYELRDQVIAAVASTTTAKVEGGNYADQIAKNTMSQVYASGNVNGAVIIDPKANITSDQLKDLVENGPKNELYLQPGQTVTFGLNQAAQIGLKGVNGEASYKVENATISGTGTVSTTDMFYKISAGNGIKITNTSTTNILSITKIKAFNIASSTSLFAPLTEESLTAALVGLGYEKAPAPTATATPTPTVTATAAPTQKPVQQIKLATPKLGKVVSAGYNALKLNWSKVKGADGYRVYVKVNGQWKALGNTKSTTYIHKYLETGKSYTYTVKAYKNTKSGVVWSPYDQKGITGKAALSAPSLRKAKRTSAKKAILSWKKVNGANGYVVYRKTNNGRWQIVKKITKGNITSFTDKKLSKGKKYTYTVRAYRTVGKKNIYSGYNKKGLKVK